MQPITGASARTHANCAIGHAVAKTMTTEENFRSSTGNISDDSPICTTSIIASAYRSESIADRDQSIGRIAASPSAPSCAISQRVIAKANRSVVGG